MQTTTTRLHPLLAAAAVSLIVLSGVGVAAMTGVIPVTKSQDSALEVPKEMVNPIAPAISHPVAPAPTKPRPIARTAVPAPLPVADVAPVAETPKPQAPVGQLATVESVREVKDPAMPKASARSRAAWSAACSETSSEKAKGSPPFSAQPAARSPVTRSRSRFAPTSAGRSPCAWTTARCVHYRARSSRRGARAIACVSSTTSCKRSSRAPVPEGGPCGRPPRVPQRSPRARGGSPWWRSPATAA